MTPSPEMEFFSTALALAYQARKQGVSGWDVARFQAVALRCVADDPAARDMTLRFCETVRGDPHGASYQLSNDALNWLHAAHPMVEVDLKKTSATGPLYPWQIRKDCGHD